MVQNRFYNYYKTKHASCVLLDTITVHLSGLFNPLEWNRNIHEQKLKNKVINKIHRIRHQLARGAVDDFRRALAGVAPQDYEKIMHAMFEVVGPARAKAYLAAMDPN